MKKILMGLALGLAVVLGLGFAAKNFLIRKGIESGAKWATGMNLVIEKLRLGIFSSDLQMEGVALLNPAGYEEEKMLNFPEIYGNLSLPHLMSGKIYLSNARCNMNEVVVVKNKKGEVNLTQLKGLFPSGNKEEKRTGWSLYIQRLELSVGRVVYKDYSHGEKPKTYAFEVGIKKEVYWDIKDPQVFLSVLLNRALVKTAVAKMTNLDMGEVSALAQATIEDSVKIAREQTQTAYSAAKEKTQEMLDSSKEKTKEATTSLKESAEQATQEIKNLFGK